MTKKEIKTQQKAIFDIALNNSISEKQRCELLDYLISKNEFSFNMYEHESLMQNTHLNDSLLLKTLKRNNHEIFYWLLSKKDIDINYSYTEDQNGDKISHILPFLYEKDNNWTRKRIEYLVLYLMNKGIYIHGMITPEIITSSNIFKNESDFLFDLKGSFTMADIAISQKQFNLSLALIDAGVKFKNNIIYNLCEKAFENIGLYYNKNSVKKSEISDSLKEDFLYYSIFKKSSLSKVTLILSYLPEIMIKDVLSDCNEKDLIKLTKKIVFNNKELNISSEDFIDKLPLNEKLVIKITDDLLEYLNHKEPQSVQRYFLLIQQSMSKILIKYNLEDKYATLINNNQKNTFKYK